MKRMLWCHPSLDEAMTALPLHTYQHIVHTADPRACHAVKGVRHTVQVCGFRVYQEVDGMGLRGVRPASVDGFRFEPSLHVFCGDAAAEALQQYKNDGLPKYKGLPSEFGGSGEQVDV